MSSCQCLVFGIDHICVVSAGGSLPRYRFVCLVQWLEVRAMDVIESTCGSSMYCMGEGKTGCLAMTRMILDRTFFLPGDAVFAP